MCGATLSLSSEPTMPIRRSELHPERWATLAGYGHGIASGHQLHDLAFSLCATGLGANPRCGPGPCADAPHATARAATAAAPTPGRYAARAAVNLSDRVTPAARLQNRACDFRRTRLLNVFCFVMQHGTRDCMVTVSVEQLEVGLLVVPVVTVHMVHL